MESGSQLGRYTINGLIGRGGMGAVYRATDPSLGREVALKVLPADVAADPERLERFRREARALAALNHPHIVTIYSVEQAGATHFLTMELVTGTPLDGLIAGRGLPIDRVRLVGCAVADALMAAHHKGIIHRDLKPANIVLSNSGQTKVLDFGLSKVRETAASPGATMVTHLDTQVGTIVGTPAYMSPEQISGGEVDQRTDIFSLGVVLYEMVTGIRPFSGRSTMELASSVLNDVPAPASTLRATVPAELATVIARCLEKDKGSRFPSMADVRQALERDERTASRADEGPSIAVLPFKNLSTDPDSEFFADGLAEEILNALAQIEGLRVAARASSFSFKGQTTDVGEIGAKLHVATVLDGSVRRAGSKVRVTLQLVDAKSGFQLWSERYDRDMADIFDVQDEIARAVAGRLKVTLAGGASQRLAKQLTSNVEAYELYLRGRALITKRGKHVAPGMECLKRAVELDPSFAVAWAGLADAFTVRGYWGAAPPGETMPKALTAARRAVALDPRLGEAHCALAAALMLWERDYEGARQTFVRGLELNPGFTQGRCWYGLFCLQWIYGDVAGGLAEVRRTAETDPLSAYVGTILAFALSLAGDDRAALEHARLATTRDPDALVGHWVHGLVAHWNGAFDEAEAAYKKGAEVSDRAEYPLVHMAVAYAERGRVAEARAIADELMARRARGHVSYLTQALLAAVLGDMDTAMERAHQSCDEREPVMVLFARNFRNLHRLREDPRFADVLRRLALPAGDLVNFRTR
jgi:serine/threonine protein kinase/Flp pilus assembly protein TadD